MFGSKFELFAEQKKSYRNSTSRLNLWDGPVSSGKTVASILRWIKFVGNSPDGDLIMTGKTNGSLYRNIIRPMEEFLGDEMYYHSEKDSRVIDIWDKKIFCFGANDERSEAKIRGGTFAGGYGDELTLWPESYWTMMLSRLRIAGAQFFGTTNPDNPNHYLKAKFINRVRELNLDVFNWPIDANWHLPADYLDALKKEYVGLWYRRYILGEWCVAEGSIYDFFDEKLHTGKRMPHPRYHLVGVDYGTHNPTSFGLYGVNPQATPKIWRKKGYWWDSTARGKQKTDPEYSKDMKTFLGDIKPRAIIVDPSAASFKAQLKKDHKYFVKDADNEVLEGIRLQAKMLKNGTYMIQQHDSNQECIDEYYGYVWNANSAKRGIDEPLKTGDHTKDDERYVLYTEFKDNALDYHILNRR